MSDESEDSTEVRSPGHSFAHIPALDGLRGLAVLAVVLYHFAPELLPAGFIGVDVFLVLSGFLITSLALVEIDRSGSMSIRGFFGRRARRLIPAAVATVAVVVVLARALGNDQLQSSLRGQAVASLAYVANWWSIFQNDSYQGTFGAESPLNHFWSLAVEEQFYLFFPAAFVGLALLARRTSRSDRIPQILLICALIGAVASAILMSALHDPLEDPSRPYLGTDTRSQALFVGIALACIVKIGPRLLAHRHSRRAIAIAGGTGIAFLSIVAARSDFHHSWLYDGGFLLIAIATAFIIISTIDSEGPLARLLTIGSLRRLGLISYGLYLWHWPIKVFVTSTRLGLPDTTWGDVELFAIRCTLTAAATALSWYLIETPFRRPRNATDPSNGSPRRRLVGYLAAPIIAIGLVWLVATPPNIAATASSAIDVPETASVRLPSGPMHVLWFGDSVAWTLGGGVVRFPWPDGYDSPFDPTRMIIWNQGHPQCPMLQLTSRTMGHTRDGQGTCGYWRNSWTSAIDTFPPEVVVWSGALRDTYDVLQGDEWIEFGSLGWEQLYGASLDQARTIARDSGAIFVIVGQPDVTGNRKERDEGTLLPENTWRFGRLREIQRRYADAHPDDTAFVDLQLMLCPSDICVMDTPSGIPVRPDSIHFSIEGAQMMAPLITDAIEQSLKELASAR